MHGLCAEGDGNATHLAKCPRDFVEAPSQVGVLVFLLLLRILIFIICYP